MLHDHDKRKMVEHYDTILKDAQAVLSNWNWYAKKLSEHTINTARLIVPDNIEGAVILDATASANLIYQLFDKAEVLPVPAKARSYRNVTLHVSMGHAVGKTTLVKTAKEQTPKLIENLRATLGADRRVFACSHKYVEPHLVALDTGFAAFDVGHFGAIDGRNDWQDFDTVVIYGLPYRDKTWSANTFMALRGLQDTTWLNAEGNRPFRSYRDIRKSLEQGQLVVSVVQAINRVRCRRVIDDHGNCAPVDVFLLLPRDDTGRAILDGIVREMPEVKVESWQYDAAKPATRKPRRSNHEEALVRWATLTNDFRVRTTNLRAMLGIPQTRWERIVAKLKDQTSDLHGRMLKAGARYTVEGTGKRLSGYLVKG
jgi:hypothetical protein